MIENSYAVSLHNLRRALIKSLREVKLTQLRKGFSHEQLVPIASYAPFRATYPVCDRHDSPEIGEPD